jgi:hypothetical protein
MNLTKYFSGVHNLVEILGELFEVHFSLFLVLAGVFCLCVVVAVCLLYTFVFFRSIYLHGFRNTVEYPWT